MKKKTKKLVLAKETVRSLETSDLRAINGGITEEWDCIGQTIWYKCWGTVACPSKSC